MLLYDIYRSPRGDRLALFRQDAGFVRHLWMILCVVCFCMVWIVVTNVYYFSLLKNTFYLSDSGLTGTTGRFADMLNPFGYFRYARGGPLLSLAPYQTLDFADNLWSSSWLFLGATTLGLFVAGLALSPHREKWIFAAAALLTILGQTPSNELSVGTAAHVVTAFANPLAFLSLHTHMSTLLLPYLIWPVSAFGVDALIKTQNSHIQYEPELKIARRVGGVVVLAALAIYALMCLPHLVGIVDAASFAMLAIAAFAPIIRPRAMHAWTPQLPAVAVAVALVLELGAFARYLRTVPYTGDLIQPRLFAGLEASGPVVIDYQNPAAMPFPRHMYMGHADDVAGPEAPTTDPDFPTKFAVYFIRQDDPGAFYHTIFGSRTFADRRLYEQREIRFKDADRDQALQTHMRRNDRYIYHASVALDGRSHTLQEIVDAGADSYAAALAAGTGAEPLNTSSALPARPNEPNPPPPLQWDLPLDGARLRTRIDLVEAEIKLPANFPKWVVTTLFGRDSDAVRLTADGKDLSAAQGYLIRPYTFDVGNVHEGHLVIALPTSAIPKSAHLEVDQDPLIRQVTQQRNDKIGVVYDAPSDGWMVIRNPLQPGWRATVNGSRQDIYVANGTAMAVAVKQGRNDVLLEFKPGFSLQRVLVAGYVLFGPLLVLAVIAIAFNCANVQLSRGSVRSNT
jgi:hypothetical protein